MLNTSSKDIFIFLPINAVRRSFPYRFPAVLAASFLFSPPLSHGCLRLCLSPPARRMVLPPYVSVFRLAAREQAPLSPLRAQSVDFRLLFLRVKRSANPRRKAEKPTRRRRRRRRTRPRRQSSQSTRRSTTCAYSLLPRSYLSFCLSG